MWDVQIEIRSLGLGWGALGLGSWVSDPGFGCLGLELPGLGLELSGLGFGVRSLGLAFGVSGLVAGCLDWCLGAWICGWVL